MSVLRAAADGDFSSLKLRMLVHFDGGIETVQIAMQDHIAHFLSLHPQIFSLKEIIAQQF